LGTHIFSTRFLITSEFLKQRFFCEQQQMSIPIQEFRTVPIRDDLRQKRENGDVILDADGKKFAAHSVILASQSAILANHIEKQFEAQVFSFLISIQNFSRFKRKAKSKSNGRIELKTKLAAQTMRILLQLLYHEQVSAPLETIFDVLLAADKYRILHIVDCTGKSAINTKLTKSEH